MSAESSLDWTMKSYTPPLDTPARRRGWRWIVGLLLGFCVLYGMAFALFAPFAILAFMVPPAVMSLICVWALPETDSFPGGAVELLFFAFIVSRIMWPDYLAVALPGLPWITVVRLTAFPMAIALMISISSSRTFRSSLWNVLASSRAIFTLLCVLIAIQIVTLPLSKHLAGSIDKFIGAQTGWTAMFLVSCWIFAKPGRAERWVVVLCAMTIPIGLIAFTEFKLQRLPWAGHIPGFLKIQDESVARALAGSMRAFSGRFRVKSTFTTPLGLAEYLAITAPFALHFATSVYSRPVKVLMWTAIPIICVTAYLTNARLGSIGLFAGVMIYVFVRANYMLRLRKSNMFASLIVKGYPVMFVCTLAMTYFVGRLHRIVWGGSETQASTDGRHQQLMMAIPLIAKNPIGHGIGESATVLNYVDMNGLLTIDSYFLSVLLEYGVLGFLVYFGMFGLAALRGFRTANTVGPKDRELLLLLPAAISLTVFILIRSVDSSEANTAIPFIILGMICALISRASSPAAVTAKVAHNLSKAILSRTLEQG